MDRTRVGRADNSVPKQVGPNYKHGHTWMDAKGKVHCSPTWNSWRAMRKRAGKRDGYENVRVCARWAKSFVNFLADMGERPPGMTLDRKDTTGHYEPGNCRWATKSQQAYNRRPKGYRL